MAKIRKIGNKQDALNKKAVLEKATEYLSNIDQTLNTKTTPEILRFILETLQSKRI